MDSRDGLGRLLRYAIPGALLYSAAFPLVQVALVDTFTDGREAVVALVATACFLPLLLRQVAHFVRGTCDRGDRAGLVALAAIVVLATPAIGWTWISAYYLIAVSALLMLERPWSLAVVGLTAGAQFFLAWAMDDPVQASGTYFAIVVVWRTAAVIVPLWLVREVLNLDDVRRSLAEQAVVAERVRIDEELRQSVGGALSGIVRRGHRTTTLIDDQPAAAQAEILDTTAVSRKALADARQLVRRYQRVSLSTEVASAATLLQAAGFATTVVLPPGDVADVVDDRLRDGLRSAVATLLSDDAGHHCVITVVRSGARVELEVRSDRGIVAQTQSGTP